MPFIIIVYMGKIKKRIWGDNWEKNWPTGVLDKVCETISKQIDDHVTTAANVIKKSKVHGP